MTAQRSKQPRRDQFSPITEEAARKREIGQPGGGAGRRDEVGGSGVYPASMRHGDIPHDAVLRTPAAWGQGSRGPAGYYDAGQSGLYMYRGQLLGGLGFEQAGFGAPMSYGTLGYPPPAAPPRVREEARSRPTPPAPSGGHGSVRWGEAPLDTAMNPNVIPGYPAGGRDSSSTTAYAQPRYTGRGPKNYRRSDQRIEEDVCDALTQHPEIDASDIEVAVRDSEVMLSGAVEDRRAKRLAVDIAESIAGVRDVHTQLVRRNREAVRHER